MKFAAPQMFWLLLIVPAMLLFFWWSWRVRERLMAQFIHSRLLPGLIAGVSSTRQKIRAVLILAAIVCFIVTLARLQWGYYQEEVPQKGLDIIAAIDTSKSMLASDIAPNRLARAQLAALSLMQEAKSDRLGVVAFSGTAFLECPLTIDDGAFQQSVEALNVNTISEGGTSLAEAIDTASRAFKEGDNFKVLVLFTDGEDNDEGALEAAKAAAKDGLRIFTVGIGTAAGELLQYRDQNGNVEYVRDDQGNVVKSHLNEPLLKQIAEAAGGGYYSLSGANTMEQLYQRSLAPLPKSETREAFVKRPYERYHWPLLAGIILLIAEMFFPERKEKGHRGLKRQRSAIAGAGAAATTVVGILIAALVFLPRVTSASPATAIRDYKAGKFAAAQKEYERLAAEDKKGDLRFIFNAGDAAYRATNYDDALKDFVAASASQDVKLQQKAYFNIGNVLFRQGEAGLNPEKLDLDAVQEKWEQAAKSFQNAVTLDAKDADAAHNLEHAKKGVAAIQQLKELARQAKQAADNSVKQRQYHRALEIMQQIVQQNVAAKQFEDYVKRLQNIDEIATPTPAQH